MRHAPLLAIDDAQLFDAVAAAKQQPRRGRMQAVRADILTSYGAYEVAAPALQTLAPVVMTASQREAMLHAFEVETAPLAGLRSRLLKRISVARCPFCSISESSSLDHYLPKEQNPQFAIFSKNLVPCCPTCNTRKRDKIVDEGTNVRLFLHPCYDDIPDELFINLDVMLLPDALGLTFRIVRPQGMAQAVFRHLRSHFDQLDLGNRYRLMGLDYLREQRGALARLYGPEQDAGKVAAELANKASDFEQDNGANYWLCILNRALAAHDDFCDGGFSVLNQIQ
jgi:hypothetical protein